MLRTDLTILLLYHTPPLLVADGFLELTLSPCPHHLIWERAISPPAALEEFRSQTATVLTRDTTLKLRTGTNDFAFCLFSVLLYSQTQTIKLF